MHKHIFGYVLIYFTDLHIAAAILVQIFHTRLAPQFLGIPSQTDEIRTCQQMSCCKQNNTQSRQRHHLHFTRSSIVIYYAFFVEPQLPGIF